jgi:hypothetical protein
MMVLICHMQMNRLLFMNTYLLETYIVVMSINIFRRSCLVVHDAMVVRRFPPRGDGPQVSWHDEYIKGCWVGLC